MPGPQRMGHRHWSAQVGIRHALATADKGLDHLQATGNLRAVQILLGHAKIESTVRYLGVDAKDALRYRNASTCRS